MNVCVMDALTALKCFWKLGMDFRKGENRI